MLSRKAPTTLTIRLNHTLSTFVAANVGTTGRYENASEYVRDLIRRDQMQVEQARFERLKAELQQAFRAPDHTFHPLIAADIIARNAD